MKSSSRIVIDQTNDGLWRAFVERADGSRPGASGYGRTPGDALDGLMADLVAASIKTVRRRRG